MQNIEWLNWRYEFVRNFRFGFGWIVMNCYEMLWLYIAKGIPQNFYCNYPKNSQSWEVSVSIQNMVSYDFLLFMLRIEASTGETNSMPFLVFRRDHLRSTSGIICGSGSFAVQFGDHFRSGDHLRRCTVLRSWLTILRFTAKDLWKWCTDSTILLILRFYLKIVMKVMYRFHDSSEFY